MSYGLVKLVEQYRSLSLVYAELTEDKNDALADWARANRDVLFREASQKVQEQYNEIADYVNEHYEEPHAKEFLKGADGWLVAHAAVEGGQIVTWERRVGAMQRNSKVKIPDVADHFDVKCVKIWEMTKSVGMKVSVG